MIATLKTRYLHYLQVIGAERARYPFLESPMHDGSWHVEAAGNAYRFIITDRGSVLETQETTNIDLVLYWMMDHVTNGMASEYELRHRIPNQDSRYLWFHTQESLMALLSPHMFLLTYDRHERLLPHPYPVA